jgi:hypothetical protein
MHTHEDTCLQIQQHRSPPSLQIIDAFFTQIMLWDTLCMLNPTEPMLSILFELLAHLLELLGCRAKDVKAHPAKNGHEQEKEGPETAIACSGGNLLSSISATCRQQGGQAKARTDSHAL